MKNLLKSLAVVASLLLLVGCRASNAPAPVQEPTPTPVAATASPEQLASVITEHETSWREYEEDIVDCALASIVGKSVMDEIMALTCKTTSSTVAMTANAAARDLRKLDAPPAEMSDLVARTLLALDNLGATGADTECIEDRESEACENAATLANGAIRPLVSVLDAWKPYTG
ncbi:hypothetical protein [Specibacter sp. NPDC078692]|uniref:hypothetical protein n=1 Tax=Specibacter sp. NPDC078692 TaxID=3155818 RepID=UPI003423DDD8